MTSNYDRLLALIAPGNKHGGFIVHNDQPVTCPECGSRTDFVEVPEFTLEANAQVHTCLNPECRCEFATCDEGDDEDDDDEENPAFTVSIHLRVQDRDELVRAAQERAVADGLYATVEEAQADGEYTRRDLGACLRMLLDPGSLPGCKIDDSDSERHW